MSEQCRDHLDSVRLWALVHNKKQELSKALEYLRTYSGGPEVDWQTHLMTDTPFNKEEKNFIAVIKRKGVDDVFRPYMTIGMIWDEREQNWSFHS